MAHKDGVENKNSEHEKVLYFCGGMKRVNLEDFDENGYYKYNEDNSNFEYDELNKDVNILLALRRLGLLEDNSFSIKHSNSENNKR